MTNYKKNSLASLGLAALLVASVGCENSAARFRLNRVQLKKQEVDAVHVQPIANALEAMFGTPDEPYMVKVDGVSDVINVDQLEVAAGPVRVDELGVGAGLYRRHCVHCHGVTGDGKGPTAAFLNPYPRDFRMGAYKFKSTITDSRPTDEDLHRTLMEGVPGTAMPSFKLLDSGERDALVNYIKYLSIRGEVERQLIVEASDYTDEDEFKPDFDLLVGTVLTDVIDTWKAAGDNVTELPERPSFEEDFDMKASIARGKELYYGAAICVSCHGDTQLGDGQVTDYDEWNKEFHDWAKENDPEVKKEKMDEFVALGGLPPRNIIPRNLRQGVFRGGRRPADIFYKVKNGINGTPMPTLNKSISDEDVWHIVNYVQSLQYEELSRPGIDKFTKYQRERL